MSNLRAMWAALLCTGLVAGCGSAAPTTAPTATAQQTVAPTVAPTPTPRPSADDIPYLPEGQDIDAGTYRLLEAVLGSGMPSIRLTVPDGWNSGAWLVNRERGGDATVAVQFWNVDQVYGHPCKWMGTLFDPGPTASDLAAALKDRPLRNATAPADVTLDGQTGKYLEWSVPATIEFSQSGNPAPSAGCDADDGGTAFYSFTGRGFATNRYQQGPGQLDRLWILDVPGGRLVIDAFSMPSANAEDIQQLLAIVASTKLGR